MHDHFYVCERCRQVISYSAKMTMSHKNAREIRSAYTETFPLHHHLARVCEYNRTVRSSAIAFENDNFLYKNRSNQPPDFGQSSTHSAPYFIGMSEDFNGNIIVVVGNGKSRHIPIPTLSTRYGAICATDIKGKLSNHYAQLFHQGCATQPYITQS